MSLHKHFLSRDEVAGDSTPCNFCGFPFYAGNSVWMDESDIPYCSDECYKADNRKPEDKS